MPLDWDLDIMTPGVIRPQFEGEFHRTIKKVGEDIDGLKANTAIAAMMTLLNDLSDTGSVTEEEYKLLLTLLSPFAPHVTEELWQILGGKELLCKQPWPQYDEKKCVEQTVEIVVQVCGKIKAHIMIDADAGEEATLAAAKAAVADQLDGKTVVKEICVPGKLVNFVAK